MLEDDSLADFVRRDVDVDGTSNRVYVTGEGPAVILMSEMPGISPHLARFARWLRDDGFAVYMPSLFGRDGAVGLADEGAALFGRLCVNAEFRALRAGQSSPSAGGCAASHGSRTPSAADRASARSACASPGTSPFR